MPGLCGPPSEPIEAHGSVIGHLLSQLKPGMDLTKVGAILTMNSVITIITIDIIINYHYNHRFHYVYNKRKKSLSLDGYDDCCRSDIGRSSRKTWEAQSGIDNFTK